MIFHRPKVVPRRRTQSEDPRRLRQHATRPQSVSGIPTQRPKATNAAILLRPAASACRSLLDCGCSLCFARSKNLVDDNIFRTFGISVPIKPVFLWIGECHLVAVRLRKRRHVRQILSQLEPLKIWKSSMQLIVDISGCCSIVFWRIRGPQGDPKYHTDRFWYNRCPMGFPRYRKPNTCVFVDIFRR